MILRSVSLLIAISLAIVSPAGAAAKRYGEGDTGIVRVSHEPGVSQGEEPLSVNPRNPRQLTTVANVFQPNFPGPLNPFVGGGGIQDSRVYSSRDGGRHWLTQKLDQGGLGKLQLHTPVGNSPEFSDAFNIVNTDSDSAWDRHGNAYFESGDIHGLYHNGNEVETIWRSTDGGVTWGPHRGYTAVNATQERTELDRPWLAVDQSGRRRAPRMHDGRIYTTFETTPFANIPPQVYIKHSDDHAAHWSPTVRVDDGIYETQWNPRARPAVGRDGAVNVVYDRAPPTSTPFASYSGPIELVLARSVDGGKTFTRRVVDSDVRRVVSPEEATPAYTEMISAIAVDPRQGRRVAVAWPQAKGGERSRILLRYTSDGSRHWSRRLDVADDPARKDDQHDHVTLAWHRDGRLFVGWRDRRCCGGTFEDRYQQWVRVLNTRGGRLVPGRRIEYSNGPQPATESGRGQLQPDEFQGLVATRLGVGLTWSQLGRDGLDHLTFRSVPLSAFKEKGK
jgi:hypothetical protein